MCPSCVAPLLYTRQTLTLRRKTQMMSLNMGLGDSAVLLSDLLSALLSKVAMVAMVVWTGVSIGT